MKTALFALVILIVAAIAILLVLGLMSRSGSAPGLAEGKLTPCSSKPNCVCSEFDDSEEHHVPPFAVELEESERVKALVLVVIAEMGGTLIHSEGDYLTATFSSAIFGFVDDVELRLDIPNKRIHLRSASRFGYSDGGVNRKRMDRFRLLLQEKLQVVK